MVALEVVERAKKFLSSVVSGVQQQTTCSESYVEVQFSVFGGKYRIHVRLIRSVEKRPNAKQPNLKQPNPNKMQKLLECASQYHKYVKSKPFPRTIF